MKAISLVKVFTVVGLMVVGGQVRSADTPQAEETKDQCKKRILSDSTRAAQADKTCADRRVPDTTASGTKERPLLPAERDACKKSELESMVSEACGDLESQKDKANTCKSLYDKYADASSGLDKDCGSINEDIATCIQQSKSCQQKMDPFSPNSDTASGAFLGILGTLAQMQGGQPSQAASQVNLEGCVIDTKGMADEETRIDDKITQLTEEIAALHEESAKADDELNQKKQEVQEKIVEVEEQANKEKYDRQSQNQKDAAEMQKRIMTSEKKRRDNATKIAALNIQLSNQVYEQQRINLELSGPGVSKVCKDKRDAELKAKTGGSVDPKTGKSSKPKFSQKESQQLIKDLKLLETQCLEAAALEKQKQMKAIADKKQQIQSNIDTINADNTDEQKAIDQEMQNMEQLKKISEEQDQKAIENRMKKLNALNQSVVDMESYMQKKKMSLLEKEKSKNDRIAKYQLDKLNLKAKYAKPIEGRKKVTSSTNNFLDQCCEKVSSSKKMVGKYGLTNFNKSCEQLNKEAVTEAKPAPTSGTTGIAN